MALREDFVQVEPREKAGSRSADRFDYQRDWALCELLRIHDSGSDYLIVFDLHDDVLAFDSASNPTLIWFYQIKTKKPGHWTRTDLLRRKAGANGPLLSILGKLYSNRVSFPAHTAALTFVSNAQIKLVLADGSSSDSRQAFTIAELSPGDQAKIGAQLKDECCGGNDPVLDGAFRFNVADLSMDDHEAHARGKLGDFLERLDADRGFRTSLVYRTLNGEIVRRNNYQEPVDSFDDLIQKKGISRQAFEEMLEKMGLFVDPDDIWQEASQRLNAEQMPFGRVRSLRQRWAYIEARRLDGEDVKLTMLLDAVTEALTVETSAGHPERLSDLLDRVVQRIRAQADPGATFEDDDIRVLTIMRTYETGQVSATDSSAEEGQA